MTKNFYDNIVSNENSIQFYLDRAKSQHGFIGTLQNGGGMMQ